MVVEQAVDTGISTFHQALAHSASREIDRSENSEALALEAYSESARRTASSVSISFRKDDNRSAHSINELVESQV